jgi:hypothetical protein
MSETLASPAPPDPTLRFEAAPYRPDGGCTPLGLAVLCGWTLAAAAGLGWLLSYVGQWVYAPVLFPALFGVILMFLGGCGSVLTKVRHVPAAVLVGLASGIVTMVAMHYFDYQRFQTTAPARLRDRIKLELGWMVAYGDLDEFVPGVVHKVLEGQSRSGRPDKNDPATEAVVVWERVSPELEPVILHLKAELKAGRITKESLTKLGSSPLGESLNEEIEGTLSAWASRLTFWDFLRLKADQGDAFRWKRGKLFTLRGGWLWASWGLELLAGVFVATFMGFTSVRPFCARCHQWKDENETGRAYVPATTAAEQLVAGEVGRLAATAAAADAHGDWLALFFAPLSVMVTGSLLDG